MKNTASASHPASAAIVVPESQLWQAFKAWKKDGVVFHRYASLGPYTVDFLCPEHRLIVEVDAVPLCSTEGRASDLARTGALEAKGYRIVRFWDDHVETHLDGVLRIVATALGQMPAGKATKPLKRSVTRRRGRVVRTVMTH
ncbi:endonuclease domain-containing protein [Parvularcula sp. LCG005]|uniref:endonuclease domain-containing protein n=1 Tax=Parvularcula sp. LCG005 TaxID=3078805 RepID=UPI002943C5DB|nr:endonuclease domain-containing protein [Parvularcula sp. LCG005]WOI54726.1 endonuclease domain-containing protein [Parvularcula sp. LCG005]